MCVLFGSAPDLKYLVKKCVFFKEIPEESTYLILK